jgi:O-acetyl-ADP-ribose deacetylase (regulator of RNase III)
MLKAVTEQPESACGQPVAEPSEARPEPPPVADVVADLRLLRERGLVRIRHTELAAEIRMEGNCGTAMFPVTVHVEPVELLRDVDVVVAPTNVYLEMPQPYKASISAALRRAAARRGLDGAIVADELRSWVSRHGRPGLPVAAGSVAVTSAGALSEQGIRRIYHAAVATPRPGTNDYDVIPTAITQAVYAAFAIARNERLRFTPPLKSLGFPLLGAGRGGLEPTSSFAWIWAALEREIPRDNTWAIHFITHQRATAEVIVAGISRSGGTAIPGHDAGF